MIMKTELLGAYLRKRRNVEQRKDYLKVEIKVFIICADCKDQIGQLLKPEGQEPGQTLLELANWCSERISWHNRHHGQQVFAEYTADGKKEGFKRALISAKQLRQTA